MILVLLLVTLGAMLGVLLTNDYWNIHYARLLRTYQVETLSRCAFQNFTIGGN
jgi:E3 ubiquitin-protein ligase DOA10